jgi:hypothetical protein
MMKNLFVVIALFICTSTYALKIKIVSGETQLCPMQEYTYYIEVYTDTGLPVRGSQCQVTASLFRDNSFVSYLTETTSSSDFQNTNKHYFKLANDAVLGNASLIFVTGDCGIYFNGGRSTLNINTRIVTPKPITGDNFICPGQTKKYVSAPVLSNDASNCFFHHKYVWTAPQGWLLNKLSINEVTITPPANALPGLYKVSVKTWFDDSNIYSYPVEYSITIPQTNTLPVTASNPYPCAGSNGVFSVQNPAGYTNYAWRIQGTATINEGQGTGLLNVSYYTTNGYGGGFVNVSATSVCGGTLTAGLTFSVSNCNSSSSSLRTSDPFPNPATNTLNFNLSNIDEPVQVNIKNKDGKIVRSLTIHSSQLQNMDISSISEGMYLVQIRGLKTGKQKNSRIIVQK